MTENYYTSSNYNDHTTFGGELTLFDFEGHYTMSSMTEKIIRDLSFDKQCRKNIELRNNAKKYKKNER